jgi:hypothetical protein
LRHAYGKKASDGQEGREPGVNETCMFDIMELPEETLKRVLPKVSIRIVSRLIACYPRAIGRTLYNALAESASPSTLELLKDEIGTGRLPSIHQIREAEREFLRTLNEECSKQPV